MSHGHIHRNEWLTAYTWVTNTRIRILYIYVWMSHELCEIRVHIRVHVNQSRTYESKRLTNCVHMSYAYTYYTYIYRWVTNFVRYIYIYVYMSMSHEHINRNDSPTAYTWVTHTHIIHIHIDESRTLWDTNPCIHVHENESRPYTSKWVIHCTWVTNIRISYVYTYKCVTNILI